MPGRFFVYVFLFFIGCLLSERIAMKCAIRDADFVCELIKLRLLILTAANTAGNIKLNYMSDLFKYKLAKTRKFYNAV